MECLDEGFSLKFGQDSWVNIITRFYFFLFLGCKEYRVNHDRLLARLATRVHDKRLLKLIRKFLNAGVMIGGLVESTEEGTPQGGPLSPLLSNIVLDELDKELERRGLRFARYADDFIIFIRSKRAATRVMESVSCFI
ncbi:MAG: reverse transcriptase domain-containing protein, partial [Thermodesulfobacteriota bacterium]|nr:reverse transcriptase domain-containing protein [Thermodesulfobacteriota bacterium]